MLIQILLVILAIALTLPCSVLLIECLSAFLSAFLSDRSPSRSAVSADNENTLPIAVLMPAHNEAEVIAGTLAALMPQLTPKDRLIVVADNCTDETAKIARQTGATVLERTDTDRRGKGYALDYGLQVLSVEPPAAVVIVDADCQFQRGCVHQLTHEAITHQRPVQGIYLIDQPVQPSLKESVSAFAFKVKNLVRPLGLKQLHMPCLLTGTGMAFPWSVISTVDLASQSIVEDMKLGFDLAVAGTPPMLCQSVIVTGPLPPNDTAAKTQRTRWEHGHLQLMAQYCPQLFSQALVQRRLDLLAIALDLLIPPLSLLVILWSSVSLVVTLAAALSGFWLPAWICYGAGTMLLVAVVSAWAGFAQSDLALQTLLSVPLYLIWKIPVYLKFVKAPQVEWVRTDRQVQPDE